MVHPAVTVRADGDVQVCCGPDACITVEGARRRPAEADTPDITPHVIVPTLQHSDVVERFDTQDLDNLPIVTRERGNLAVHASPGESIRLDAMNALAQQSGRSINVEVH